MTNQIEESIHRHKEWFHEQTQKQKTNINIIFIQAGLIDHTHTTGVDQSARSVFNNYLAGKNRLGGAVGGKVREALLKAGIDPSTSPTYAV